MVIFKKFFLKTECYYISSIFYALFYIKKYKILDLIVIVDNCSTDDSYKRLKKIEVDNIQEYIKKYHEGLISDGMSTKKANRKALKEAKKAA